MKGQASALMSQLHGLFDKREIELEQASHVKQHAYPAPTLASCALH